MRVFANSSLIFLAASSSLREMLCNPTLYDTAGSKNINDSIKLEFAAVGCTRGCERVNVLATDMAASYRRIACWSHATNY
jgi:hypothetical protein